MTKYISQVWYPLVGSIGQCSPTVGAQGGTQARVTLVVRCWTTLWPSLPLGGSLVHFGWGYMPARAMVACPLLPPHQHPKPTTGTLLPSFVALSPAHPPPCPPPGLECLCPSPHHHHPGCLQVGGTPVGPWGHLGAPWGIAPPPHRPTSAMSLYLCCRVILGPWPTMRCVIKNKNCPI